MFKIGDIVFVDNVQGKVVNVYSKNWIGFHPHTETCYDIILERIPEKQLKENGTD